MRFICHLNLFFYLFFCSLGFAQAQEKQTNLSQALMIDVGTGAILFQKNSNQTFAPASLAKLMTAEVVFQKLKKGTLKESDLFKVSHHAWTTGGAPSRTATMFAGLNSEISVLDLLRGMIIDNANDAAIVLAEGLAGSEDAFVKMMNERASELGLQHSHFVNSTGLPANGQYVSASDLAKLSLHIINEYPNYYSIYREPDFNWNKIFQRNKNPLLTLDINAEGMAIGYDESGGFSIVATNSTNQRKLLLILNGLKRDKDRISEATRLLKWGREAFVQKLVFDKNEIIGNARIYGGTSSNVPLIVNEPVGIMISKEKPAFLKAKIIYHGPIDAPVKAGQNVGILQIIADKTILVEKPVFTAADISETGLLGKTKDALYEFTIGWIRAYL